MPTSKTGKTELHSLPQGRKTLSLRSYILLEIIMAAEEHPDAWAFFSVVDLALHFSLLSAAYSTITKTGEVMANIGLFFS